MGGTDRNRHRYLPSVNGFRDAQDGCLNLDGAGGRKRRPNQGEVPGCWDLTAGQTVPAGDRGRRYTHSVSKVFVGSACRAPVIRGRTLWTGHRLVGEI